LADPQLLLEAALLAVKAMMEPMTATPPPLVTREALRPFTQRLVDHCVPEKVILFGSQAWDEARWDSNADILVVMPFRGSSFDQHLTMFELAAPSSPLDHGEVLHG
jgi:hypothetical protein